MLSFKRPTILFVVTALCSLTIPSFAQPRLGEEGLMHVVDRIALYPDPLLVQVLAASTYPDQIPYAADYANHHRYLDGGRLAEGLAQDRPQWAMEVTALIPFPQVLDMMARDMGWTQRLGDAVLDQRPEVMEAIQRVRRRAYEFGYLRNNPNYRVMAGPVIEIQPVDPNYIAVPFYDPAVILVRPRGPAFVGGAITFGPRISLGLAFAPWGWRAPAFGWRENVLLIDNRPWGRTWENRATYVHPYANYRRPDAAAPRFEERHEPARREHERGEERRYDRR